MRKIRSLFLEFTSFDGSLFCYSLSFSLLLALAPSLLIFALLFKLAYLDESLIVSAIIHFLPDSNTSTVNQILAFFMEQKYSATSLITTMCASFYLASRSIYSFLLISASHEDVDAPKWAIRIRSIYLFVDLAIIVVAAIFVITNFLHMLPFVGSCVLLLFFFMMYRALSFRKRNWTFGMVGALFSTILTMLLAALFVTIVKYFTSYDDIYGPLASLVTILLAIYLISCIIYLGFCLNLVIEKDYGRERYLPMKNDKFFSWATKITNKISRRL